LTIGKEFKGNTIGGISAVIEGAIYILGIVLVPLIVSINNNFR